MKRFVIFMTMLALNFSVAWGWGPLTHLSINANAYNEAFRILRNSFCIPQELKSAYIAGGPAPDIKHPAGDAFPREFHYSLEIMERMIKLAKDDPRFGLTDVIEALGWASHVFGEVNTTHAPNGYSNTKIVVALPNSVSISHQLTELNVDIITYRDFRDQLKKVALSMPYRLLEAAMLEENKRDPTIRVMKAEKIKACANSFLPTVLGVRTIAEYLIQERPELVDEIAAFHADYREEYENSIKNVVEMLKKNALLDFRKTKIESADKDEKVVVALTGSFTQKIKGAVLNITGKTLQNAAANDFFTSLTYGLVKGLLSSEITRERFLTMVKNMSSESIPGDERHRKVICRYLEGLLVRTDLTLPEILAYAQEGLEIDENIRKKQLKQFAAIGLKSDGRGPIAPTKLSEAIAEVERIERLRREWPWFWPWRPSVFDLAKAREKAARMLAFFLIDNASSSAITSHANKLLSTCKTLRIKLFEYRRISFFQPLKKYELAKEIEAISETSGSDLKFLTNFLNLSIASNGQFDQTSLDRIYTQTVQRIEHTEKAINESKQQLAKTPAWNIIEYFQIRDEILRLENELKELREYLRTLQAIKNETTHIFKETISTPMKYDIQNLSGLTLSQVEEKYAAAYKKYVDLVNRKNPQDPEMQKVLNEIQNLTKLRAELRKQAGIGFEE